MWIAIGCVALLLAVVGVYIVSLSRYYGRMFSEANFRAFHSGLSTAVKTAQEKGEDADPSLDDGTAFVTDAGLAVGATWNGYEDGAHTLHISMSQPGGNTTHAACSRFGFFALAMLQDNKAELTPFFTESGVHHLVFRFQSQDLKILDFKASDSAYRAEYKAIPFKYEKLGGAPSPAAKG